MKRNSPLKLLFPLLLLAAGPADSLPEPTSKRCIAFLPLVVEEGEVARPDGLHFNDVSRSLNAVIQTALQCERPPGLSEVHLTFDFLVGCDGVISSINTVDNGGAPEEYVDCVSSVIKKADFPAHDREDGMPVTYPVDVNW